MKRRANARGSIAAVLLPLVIATAAPVAAEPAAESSVGASSSPGGEISTPAAHAPAPGLESARHQALHRQGRPSAEDRLQGLVKGLKLDSAQHAEVRRDVYAPAAAIPGPAARLAAPAVAAVAARHRGTVAITQ